MTLCIRAQPMPDPACPPRLAGRREQVWLRAHRRLRPLWRPGPRTGQTARRWRSRTSARWRAGGCRWPWPVARWSARARL